MFALGESFRTARESQGLSLSDVADRIHIRSVYLAAIEAEDWQAIGPPVYVKGFIRSYARSIGLDPDAAIAQFSANAAGGGGAGTVVLAPSPRGEPSRSGLPRGEARRPGPSVWAVLSVALAIALVAFVGYQFIAYQLAARAPLAHMSAVPAQPAPARPELVASAARGAAPEFRPPIKKAAKSSPFAVRLKESSWVRVVIDGKVLMEGVYPAKTERTFSGRSATVRAGNAGGVDVSVDGKDLGPMGGLGDVAERSFQL